MLCFNLLVKYLLSKILRFNNGCPGTASWLAFIALVMATINVVGGFMVTNKMLEMIAGKKRGGGN